MNGCGIMWGVFFGCCECGGDLGVGQGGFYVGRDLCYVGVVGQGGFEDVYYFVYVLWVSCVSFGYGVMYGGVNFGF